MAGHGGLAAAAGAQAQGYPTKRSISTSPSPREVRPTRSAHLAQVMGKSLKQQYDRRERGRGGRHHRRGARRQGAPDGYTVLLHHIGMSTAPSLYRTLSFDPLKDFEYIGEVADVPMTLIARGNFRGERLQGVPRVREGEQGQALLRQRGPGAASHLCAVLFLSAIETDFTTRSLQGHGAGDERPAGWPGGHHVRPDHEHHRPDHWRQGEGLRRASKTRVPSLAQHPDARRAGG